MSSLEVTALPTLHRLVSFELIAKMSGNGNKEVLVLVRRREAESKKARELALAVEKLVKEYNREIYSNEKKISKKTEKNREQRRKKKERKALGKAAGLGADPKGDQSPPHAYPDPKKQSSYQTPPLANLEILKSYNCTPNPPSMTNSQEVPKKEKPNSTANSTSSASSSQKGPERKKTVSEAKSSNSKVPLKSTLNRTESLLEVQKRERAEFLAALRAEQESEAIDEDLPSRIPKSEPAVQTERARVSIEHQGSESSDKEETDEKIVSATSSSSQKGRPGVGKKGKKKK